MFLFPATSAFDSSAVLQNLCLSSSLTLSRERRASPSVGASTQTSSHPEVSLQGSTPPPPSWTAKGSPTPPTTHNHSTVCDALTRPGPAHSSLPPTAPKGSLPHGCSSRMKPGPTSAGQSTGCPGGCSWDLLTPGRSPPPPLPAALAGRNRAEGLLWGRRRLRWDPAAGTDHAAQPGQHLPKVLRAQTFSLISGTASVFHNARKRKNYLTTYIPHDIFLCSQVALDRFPPTKGPPSRQQLSSLDFLPLRLCLSSSPELLQVSL